MAGGKEFEVSNQNDLIGAINLGGKWRFYVASLAEWIMDYESYDPGSDPRSPNFEPSSVAEDNDFHTFRNGIYVVTERNAADFCSSLSEVTPEDIKEIVEHKLLFNTDLCVVIDFTRRIFVNGTFEVEIHNYVPRRWRGFEGVPTKYIPDTLNLWKSPNQGT